MNTLAHPPLQSTGLPDGLEVVRDPAALPADARAFLAQAETRCYEFGERWFANLTATVYGSHQGLRLYVLREQGRITALLPMRAEKAALGWQLHALGNFYTTLFEPLLAPGSGGPSLARVLDAACRDLSGLGKIQIAPMDRDGPAFAALVAGMREAGLRPYEYFAFGNWYQPVVGSWTDYLAERNGTLRSTIKRMTRKFDGDGGHLELITDSAALARGIAAYEQVYANSWKQPEPFPDFIPGLMRTCAAEGKLRLGLAWLDGKAIAAQLWIVCHGRAEIYKVAYDEGFKAYAPGTLLTAMLMKHVIEVDQVQEVDYLIGDDAYKKTWMSHRRERWGVVAYNPANIAGLLGWAREAAGRRWKAWRSTAAEKMARRAAQHAPAITGAPAPGLVAHAADATEAQPKSIRVKPPRHEGDAPAGHPPRKEKGPRPPKRVHAAAAAPLDHPTAADIPAAPQ